MALSSEQLKGRLKNVASKNGADARILLRMYMMERFLERVSVSEYKDNFIIKGGMLITSMIGLAMRSTMDIDTSIKNANVSANDVKTMVEKISAIDLDDGAGFKIREVSNIMDEMEYPGIRVSMEGYLDRVMTPLKIDVSTGDIITPGEIIYEYPLMLEERSIEVWSYNLETVLAEKLQTILARGILNTRLRDFYDIHVLLEVYREKIGVETIKAAFNATATKRETLQLIEQALEIVRNIKDDINMNRLWESYQRKYSYARDITFDSTIQSVRELVEIITK